MSLVWRENGSVSVHPLRPFFVTEDALKRLHPAVPRDEAGLLLAFDANRDLIYAAAVKANKRDRKGSYELAARDF